MFMLLEKIGEDPKSYVLALRWMGYLLQHVNHQGLYKVLSYYQDIGWISNEVKEKLLTLAQGLKGMGGDEWTLPFRVHLTSLLFIGKLGDVSMERDLAGMEAYIEEWIENPEGILSI